MARDWIPCECPICFCPNLMAPDEFECDECSMDIHPGDDDD